MFTDFKDQFKRCICYAFITGILVGITISFITFNLPIKEIIIFGGLSLVTFVLTVLFWKITFHDLNLQDKINSIYTDID